MLQGSGIIFDVKLEALLLVCCCFLIQGMDAQAMSLGKVMMLQNVT